MVTCLERADLLALVGDVYCIFDTFPCGILGQVWYLIVLFPDLCHLSYFLQVPHSLWHLTPGPEVIQLFPCSTQLSMKFILLINNKMPTISMINIISKRLKARNFFGCRYFNFL